jgi:hypothetical protein
MTRKGHIAFKLMNIHSDARVRDGSIERLLATQDNKEMLGRETMPLARSDLRYQCSRWSRLQCDCHVLFCYTY